MFQLDAKKSPLALLAQTCSAIGKEPIAIAKSLRRQTTQLHFNDSLNPSSNVFRKTSAVCAAPSSSLPRIPATSPALSEGKAENLRRDKSPPKSMASYIANWRTFSQMTKYGELAKLQAPETDRKKSAIADNRKRKSATQSDVCERKMSKPDRQHGTPPQLPSSPASGSSTSRMYLSPTELQHKEPKPSHPLRSLYDSYCFGCHIPNVGGTSNCIDPLKSTTLPFHPFGNSSANAYPLYAQMLMSASRSSVPSIDSSQFVCNWVDPRSGTCGKRFSSAEELSNHLKTHVSATPTSAGTDYFSNSLEKFATSPYAAAYLSHAAALAAATPVPNAMSSNLLSHSPLGGYKANMLSQFTKTTSISPLPIAAAAIGPYSSSPLGHYGPKLNPAVTGFGFPV